MSEPSTWSKVFVGVDLLIKGDIWTITKVQNVKGQNRKITAQKVGTNREHTSQPDPDGVVQVERWPAPAIPGVDPTALATQVVQASLGGEVVMESKGAGDLFPRCPKRFQTTGALQSHLYVFHGVRSWEQAGTWDEASAMHDALHHSIRTGGPDQPVEDYRDHTHDLEI